MDADKKQPDPAVAASTDGNPENAPSTDALGKPSDAQSTGAMSTDSTPASDKPPKKLSPVKKILRHVNIYIIIFAVVFIGGGVVAAIAYINSKKTPPTPTVQSQNLTEAQLKQLANSNATVGGSGQTLTVQGNAVFTGNVLVRSDLNVAGTIQMGGPLTLPQLNVSSSANLASTQINNLQVAGGSTFQSLVTLQNGLTAGGVSSFTGSLTVGTINVSKLVASNNALLTIPNHVSFTGTAPHVTSGSATISGSDTNGTVTVSSGAGAGQCMVTLAFNQSFSSTPHVLISPMNQAAAGIEFYATRNTSNFSICTAAGVSGGQQMEFSYFITD